MIRSFGNKLAENLFHGKPSKEVRSFPHQLRAMAIRKLTQIDVATQLNTLSVPAGNKLEALKGNWKGFHSIRINDQWRICFQWTDLGVMQVQIVDYHS